MTKGIRNRFLQYGWLAPATFPLTMIGGRGLFHTIFFLYVLWALASARKLRIENHRTYLLLFLLLMASYAISIPFATDVTRALKSWGTLLLFSGSTLVTLAMLQQQPDNLRRLLSALGVFGLIAVFAAYADLGHILLFEDEFMPRLQLKAVSLTFYLPFLLAWLWLAIDVRGRRLAAIALAITAITGYVILSEERSAFVGLICALACLGILVLRARVYLTLAFVAGVVMLAVTLNGEALLRGLSGGQDSFAHLDAFSSGRLTLWSQAIQYPPDNWLIGAGMNNARYHVEAVSIDGYLVKHLHNIWLDTWYETGALGLAMLVGLLIYIFSTTARRWKAITGQDRLGAALFLTGALTILAEAQFSISYASREFSIYAFTCFAALLHLARSAASRPTHPVAHTPENRT
jgi:O-antigen ligase